MTPTPNYRGAYDHSANYQLGDVVIDGGTYYIRIGDPGEAYYPGDTIAWGTYNMPTYSKSVTGSGSISGSGDIN
jgi:hypothetical protein